MGQYQFKKKTVCKAYLNPLPTTPMRAIVINQMPVTENCSFADCVHLIKMGMPYGNAITIMGSNPSKIEKDNEGYSNMLWYENPNSKSGDILNLKIDKFGSIAGIEFNSKKNGSELNGTFLEDAIQEISIGMTVEKIVGYFGQPEKQFSDLNGGLTYIYRFADKDPIVYLSISFSSLVLVKAEVKTVERDNERIIVSEDSSLSLSKKDLIGLSLDKIIEFMGRSYDDSIKLSSTKVDYLWIDKQRSSSIVEDVQKFFSTEGSPIEKKVYYSLAITVENNKVVRVNEFDL